MDSLGVEGEGVSKIVIKLGLCLVDVEDGGEIEKGWCAASFYEK